MRCERTSWWRQAVQTITMNFLIPNFIWIATFSLARLLIHCTLARVLMFTPMVILIHWCWPNNRKSDDGDMTKGDCEKHYWKIEQRNSRRSKSVKTNDWMVLIRQQTMKKNVATKRTTAAEKSRQNQMPNDRIKYRRETMRGKSSRVKLYLFRWTEKQQQKSDETDKMN